MGGSVEVTGAVVFGDVDDAVVESRLLLVLAIDGNDGVEDGRAVDAIGLPGAAVRASTWLLSHHVKATMHHHCIITTLFMRLLRCYTLVFVAIASPLDDEPFGLSKGTKSHHKTPLIAC